MKKPKRLFKPDEPRKCLEGWLLHAHKERDRHNSAARSYARKHVLLGLAVVILAAVAGTAPKPWVDAGWLSVAAAVFAAMQTFLDYGGRAEKHRMAAVSAKTIIREIEKDVAIAGESVVDSTRVESLQARFDAIEKEAPVVSSSIHWLTERKYKTIEFVDTPEKLHPKE